MSVEFAIRTLSGGDASLVSMDEMESLWLNEGAHDDDAFDFVPTKIVVASSGAKAFQVGESDMVKAPLVAYVIDSVKIRSYYPSRNGSKVPLCSSVGGKYGSFNLGYLDEDLMEAAKFRNPHPALLAIDNGDEIEDFYSCAQCPLSEFNSAIEGAGQACKIKIRLLVLPEGWATPAIMILPTMSVAPWNRFCSSLRSVQRRPFYAYKIAFNIERKENADGQPYGVVLPEVVSEVGTVAEAQAVLELQRQFREYVRNRAVARDDDEDAYDE